MRYFEILEICKKPPYYSESFVESWIFESPQRYQQSNLYDVLITAISGIKQSKYTKKLIVNMSNGWFKYKSNIYALYWHEIDKVITIGVELDITHQSAKVNFVAKNPEYSSKSPYASDLYNIALVDLGKSILLTSDNKLSDKGFGIWAKLLDMGHKIHVYDVTKPGESFISITDIDDLKSYWDDDPKFQNYRYVLTEENHLWIELQAYFRRAKYMENLWENNNS